MTAIPVTGIRKNRRRSGTLRRAVATLVISAVCVILALSTPAGAGALFGYLQIYPAIAPSRLPRLAAGSPAAVVILSAGRRNYAPEFDTAGKGTVDGLSLERLRYGALVARQTKLPVLVSGGTEPVALGILLAETLIQDYRLTPRWVEAKSTNTAQNAIFSSAMLKASGIRRVILVTHAWHMKRAVTAFEANGMTVIPAPTAFYSPMPEDVISAVTPSLATFRMSEYGMHELIGGIWYRLRYGY